MVEESKGGADETALGDVLTAFHGCQVGCTNVLTTASWLRCTPLLSSAVSDARERNLQKQKHQSLTLGSPHAMCIRQLHWLA